MGYHVYHNQRRSQGTVPVANAAPSIQNFEFVAMIVPTIIERQYPLNCMAAPMTPQHGTQLHACTTYLPINKIQKVLVGYQLQNSPRVPKGLVGG